MIFSQIVGIYLILFEKIHTIAIAAFLNLFLRHAVGRK